MVKRYLEWGGNSEDKSLIKYIKHLAEQEGLAPGSIDLHRRTIQAFYRHFNLRVPRARAWRYDPKDAHRPALGVEIIKLMVGAARAGNLTNRQSCLLALATTYGLRAGEMAVVQYNDVDPDGQQIYLRTLKGGRARWCWLPPEISPYVADPEPGTPNAAEKTFANIWAAVMEIDRPRETNWHAARRALVRDLVQGGASDGAVGRFLRWSAGGGRGPEKMVSLYARPSEIVTPDGIEAARTEGEGRREFDLEVWEKHPYLKLWRD